MKHLIIILLGISFSLTLSSQGKNDVIASAGGNDNAGNISLSWTLGELVVPTFTNGNLSLIHGFQQQVIVTSVEENLGIPVDVKVYPNPAGDYLNIGFREPVEKQITVTLFDASGKPVLNDVIDAASSEKMITIHKLAAGVYYLKLTRGRLVNVYKVVKL